MDDSEFQIEEYDITPEILEKVKLQIEKDLGLCGFQYPAHFQAVNLPVFVPDLKEKIEQLKSVNSGDIMKIVYRVDLTEKQFKKVSQMPGDWCENLAKAIVLREFQKIVIRNRFST